ncbi:MAG: aminotransferase class V-fold PLP-dependent enzyme [Longimicrobiales bacterium]
MAANQDSAATIDRLRREFPIADSHVFLNHAGVGPTSLRVVDAVGDFMTSMAHLGRPSFDDWEAIADGCRDRFAKMIGAVPEEIAFIRNTSHGLSLVASGLDWRAGDRIAVATAVEYPSNVYPWLDLQNRGLVQVDDIEAPGGVVTVEAVERALRPETRLLAVSSAQYATGGVTDLTALGTLCRDRGVLFCVDGIQTVGALPVDVKSAGIHFMSADSHKWMLGMMGIGAIYVDREVIPHVHPPLIGWRSTTDSFNFDRVHLELVDTAVRFEEGSLAYPLIAGFAAALDILLEVGVPETAAHVGRLVERLADGLSSIGCLVGPEESARRHIATFTHPGLDGEVMLESLHAARIVTSYRRGAVRVSPHFYNTNEDMDRVVDTVRRLVQ